MGHHAFTMASDPQRHPAEDTVVVDADQLAARDQEWPVAELYRVELEEARTAEPCGEKGGVAISPPTTPASQRRKLPDLGVPLLAIAAGAGAVALAVILLASSDDGQPARAVEDSPASSLAHETATHDTSSPSQSASALPSLVGMKVEEAQRLLEERGLRVRVTMARSERDRGLVLRQDPVQGKAVRAGETVGLVISRGSGSQPAKASSSVPWVVGLSASDAVVSVRDAGFVAEIRLVTSTGRAGLVLRQSPGGEAKAPPGSTVRLEVSKTRAAPPRVEVPVLLGSDVTDARRELGELGLTVEVFRIPSTQPVGTVIRQSPRAGTRLAEKTRVSLTVSSGPEKVGIPDVTGLDAESARTELENAGFEVTVTYEPTSDPAEDGLVQRQTPGGGSTAAEGSTVTIVVAQLS